VHYDGPDESRRRKEEARAKLKIVYYKHEATFTFEKFVTSLYDGFEVLEKYGEPLYEEEKLRLLFDKCQNVYPEFKQEVVICRSQCLSFASAVIYLKTVVARLFSDIAKPKSRRNVSSVSSKELNGVDISDLSRWYDSSEIKKLNESQAGRRILAKIMGGKKRHQRHKDRSTELNITSADESSLLQLSRPRTAAHCLIGTGEWLQP